MIKAADMLITIGARMGGKVINLVVFLLLARMLSVEELGMFGFVYTTSFFLTAAFDVGTRNSAAYYIGRRPDDLGAFTTQVFFLWSILAVLATLGVAVVFRITINDLLNPTVFIPSAVLIVAMLFMRMGQGVLLGQGRIAFFNQTELAARLVLALITAVLIASGAVNLRGALWAYGGSQLAAAMILAWGLKGQVAPLRWRDIQLSSLLLKRGFLFMLGVLLMIASKRAAFMVLSQLGTSEELGLFYGLQRLTEVLTEVGTAVAVVVFSQNVRAATDADAVAAAAQSTRMSLAVFSAVAGGLALSAGWLLPLALGSEFAGEMVMFRVLLIGTLIGSIWTILFPSLSAITSPMVPFLIFLPNVIVNVALTWWLYARMSIVGAAWAFTLTNVLLSCSYLLAFRVKYRAPLLRFIVPERSDFKVPWRRIASRLSPARR